MADIYDFTRSKELLAKSREEEGLTPNQRLLKDIERKLADEKAKPPKKDIDLDR